jgi:hypothetical protein
MKKLLVISECSECPYQMADPQDIPFMWGKNYCDKLKIELIDYPKIPKECPLKTLETKEELDD